MSALLRQSGGFEGLGGIAVGTKAPQLPAPQRVIQTNLLFDLGAAALSGAHQAGDRDDTATPGIKDSDVFDLPRVPRLGHAFEVERPRLRATVGRRVHVGQYRDELEVLSAYLAKRRDVRPVERVPQPLHYLHVLLRHRPCSIAEERRNA